VKEVLDRDLQAEMEAHTLTLPNAVAHWSLTSMREKLFKIGAKIVTDARYVIFQMAEVAVPRELFREILRLIEGPGHHQSWHEALAIVRGRQTRERYALMRKNRAVNCPRRPNSTALASNAKSRWASPCQRELTGYFGARNSGHLGNVG